MPADVRRVLRLDPRPPDFGSIVEATASDDDSVIVDAAFEMAEWRPVPAQPDAPAAVAPVFVDGVQQHDRRFCADDGDGLPIAGVLASYAAGAVCPGSAEPLRHVCVQRAAILAKGARPQAIAIAAQRGAFTYAAQSAPGDGPEALESKLNHLRSELEAAIVRQLLADGAALVVVDGRLPPHVAGNAVGLIKTPQRMPIASGAPMQTLRALRAGERSPVFVRARSDRRYYSWFVALVTPGPRDVPLANLAMMEMDDSASHDDVIRMADLTAALLPRYASRPHRDPRAPQNLLPVGELERALRHRMGDRLFIARLIQQAFAREEYTWGF